MHIQKYLSEVTFYLQYELINPIKQFPNRYGITTPFAKINICFDTDLLFTKYSTRDKLFATVIKQKHFTIIHLAASK